MNTLEAVTVKVDGKGRIVIPKNIRRQLNIGRQVRLRVEDNKIILEPVRDPLDELAELVVESKITASKEPEKISQIAEQELGKLGKG
ncbi:AbrB/MazE/SpoVT family DNA-binding domain-containing protein [Candidatus Bathyarchaeota archaeon]|nr:MAG: AbrB/MazE/SpoVT family DNA-binding domain-containing protein [Candidatus Bathyarchaeota archaeon]